MKGMLLRPARMIVAVALATAAAYAQGDGASPLYLAAAADDVPAARRLITAGADVNTRTRVAGLTPLFAAATNGDAAMIELLAKAGADVNAADSTGATVLMSAATSGSEAAVRALLNHGAKVDATENAHTYTAIFFAASAGRGDVIRVLAQHHAKLDLTSKVTRLVAEKSIVDDDDYPLDAEVILHNNLPPGDKEAKAALAGRRASAEITGGLTPLLLAARDNQVEAVKALLDSDAGIDQPSASDKTTPLVMAAINGHWDLAMYLVGRGANPNLANADGLAPLYAVIDAQWAPIGGSANPQTGQEKTSHVDLMRALLEKGANPNARLGRKLWYRPTAHDQMWVGTPGSTAFWRAAQATDLAAMKVLIEHRADPKISSNEADTPLMMASGIGWAGNFSRNAPDGVLAAVRYCLDLGIDPNLQDATGYTALDGAAWRGENDAVKLLVERGARLDTRTYRNWSATDFANGPSLRTTVPVPHPDTVSLLQQLGAPPLLQHADEDILGVIKRPPK
jgi:ankyrin repeat protein